MPDTSDASDLTIAIRISRVRPNLTRSHQQMADYVLAPVSYTHLTLPTNREV